MDFLYPGNNNSWRMIAAFVLISFQASVGFTEVRYRPLPIDGGGYIQCIAVSPHDSNLVIAGVDVGGIARSTDGGKSWRMANDGLLDEFDYSIADVAFAPGRPGWVYAAAGKSGGVDSYEGRLLFSSDGGNHWRRQNADVSFAGNWLNRQFGKIIVVDAKDPLHLWVGTTTQGVLESHDGGKTWVPRGPENIDLIRSLVADPKHPERMYVCARSREAGDRSDAKPIAKESGIWVTDDAGKTWTRTFMQPIVDLAVSPDGSVIAGGGGFVIRSEDNGRTWRPFDKGLPKDSLKARYEWTALAADPFCPARFLAGSKRDPDFYHPSLFVKEPGVESWQALDANPAKIYQTFGRPGKDGWHGFTDWFAASTSTIVFDPTVKGRVFLTDWYTVARSDDGGRHWQACNKGLCSTVARDAAWDRAKPGRIYLGVFDVGFHSGDVNRWTVHSDRDIVHGAHANCYQFVWKGKVITLVGMTNWTNECLIYQRVNDQPWQKVYDGRFADQHPFHDAGMPIAFNPQTGQVLALASNLVLLYSKDGGEHFVMYRDARLTKPGMVYSVRFVMNRWFVAMADGIYSSPNLSGTWTKSDLPGFPVGQTPNGLVACIIRDGQIHRTADGGASWTPIFRFPSDADSRRLGVDMGGNGDIYAEWCNSDGPCLSRSRDSGKTWQPLPRPPGYWPAAMVVPDPRNPSRFIYVTHGLGCWLAEDKSKGERSPK